MGHARATDRLVLQRALWYNAMLRASPVDPDRLIKQKELVAAVIVWMRDNQLQTLSQSLAYAAHELVYRTIAL